MDETLFTMSAADIREYGVKHGYSQMMFGGSSGDYIASRCLILNVLWSGFPLFSQSIEKMLKAYIHLETGQRTNLIGNDRHNPYFLKEELQQRKDYGLNQFDDLLKRLYTHYQSRYHDNKDRSGGMGAGELNEFDALWIYLFDAAPFPLQVKYRLSFTHELFAPNARELLPQYFHWATHNNQALASRIKEMEQTHFAVEKHYIESAQQLSKHP
jgi:hypothetical protein